MFIFLLFISSFIQANMAPEGFERFPNNYFVETGTFGGAGIELALRTGYFKEIHSIEIDAHFVKEAKRKFNKHHHINIWHGDSGKILWDVIKNINEPITFWLDGHRGIPDPKGGNNTPLLDELEQIKWHPIKIHTIVIDDMHCCGTILFDYMTQQDIINKILAINPEYTITYVNGGDKGQVINNIMVAYVA